MKKCVTCNGQGELITTRPGKARGGGDLHQCGTCDGTGEMPVLVKPKVLTAPIQIWWYHVEIAEVPPGEAAALKVMQAIGEVFGLSRVSHANRWRRPPGRPRAAKIVGQIRSYHPPSFIQMKLAEVIVQKKLLFGLLKVRAEEVFIHERGTLSMDPGSAAKVLAEAAEDAQPTKKKARK